MKRILLAVALLALMLSASRSAEARTDISIGFFYDNLNDGGTWVEVADYGYCWQPTVAVSNRSWRPYSDGYWAYTDVGWTWVSYEDFGWATYHYGRWMRLRGRGWVWVPGREWGPAWVSWRTGGDYVGWAPLPPRRAGEYWDERPITARVDIEFDIGPAYYNFVNVRYIGEPVLRERIFASEQNVTYITQTVNVTNITYTNSTVYNYGPDYDTLSRYSTRPIQRLSLQRETDVDPAIAVQSKSLMKVQGDKLVVAAPPQLQKVEKTVAPKVVKEKIAQVPIERGWEPVSDPKKQAELKEKFKKEDPKSVPPPTVQASEKTDASQTPSVPTTSATGATATPAPKDKRDKRKDTASPAPSLAPSLSPDMTPRTTPVTTPEKNKNKNKRDERVAPSVPPPVSVPPATTPVLPPPSDKRKNKPSENAMPKATIPPSTGVTETAPTVVPKPDKGPKEKPEKRKVEPPPAPAPPQSSGPDRSSLNMAPPPPVKPEKSEKPKHEPSADSGMKREAPKERVQPPAMLNPPANPSGRDDGGKKQKKNEPSTSPTP